MMSKQFILAATAASVVALLSGPAFAQQSSIPQENAATARRLAQEARTKPLIEAEKTRPRIGGYWQISTPVAALTTTEGKAAPLNAAGKKLLNQRAADKKAGKTPDPMEMCLPPGSPRSMLVNQPFLLTQAPAKVTFFMQTRHVIRHVYLDGPLKPPAPDDRLNLWEGISSGRWEGDTLIVETGDFNGKQWLDDSGLPQSPDMKVTERFRRIDAATLEDVITIADATYYSRPWSARISFRALPQTTLLIEEQCSEKLLEAPLLEYAPPKK